ncbi:MAG: OmpA family protein [Proteobacteria bacterium]|nr:OmpA family protein [Pseudomonadota bacterium]
MAGSTRIRGRGIFGGSITLALVGLLFLHPAVFAPTVFAPVAFADELPAEDPPVGWPLRDSDKARTERELRRQRPPTPLPQRSEVTDRALAAWAGEPPSIPSESRALDRTPMAAGAVESLELPADSNNAAAPARIASPEIAPLKRITPPVRHELIIYAPGDFSISVGTAGRLAQMAMRLRGTRDRISIIAHSGTGPGDAQISTHEAVKLSFKRAMLVRLYLIEEGVSPDQIDLEALPRATDDGPPDRVEISPTSKAARR